MTPIKVFAASDNPVKLAGVKRSFDFMLDGPALELKNADVQTSFSYQPLNGTIKLSAQLRMLEALKLCEALGFRADYVVALESGIVQIETSFFCTTWASIRYFQRTPDLILDSLASSSQYLIPPEAGKRVTAGEEFGPVMDSILGTHNSKQAKGSICVLSGGKLCREDEIFSAVCHAMVPLIPGNRKIFFP